MSNSTESYTPIPNKMRVCHFPQVPCEPFVVEVQDEVEAFRIVDILAQQHLFLLSKKMIPDYSNVICVEMYEEDVDGSGHPDWCDYFNESVGMDFDELSETYLNDKRIVTNFAPKTIEQL